MGVARTPGHGRPRPARRSIRFTFIAMVIVPVLCLVVIWGLAVGLTPGGALIRQSLFSSGHHGLAEVAAQVGAGVIVILAAVVLMGLFARRLTREVSGLEVTARHVADAELPRLLADLRGEELSGEADDFTPPAARITEIVEAAAAITSLRQAAVASTTDEAGLRRGIAQVFVSLARRNQSLLQRQLHLIDTLEQKATNPGDLAELFSLDHLTTRMRRHAENLIVLSGSSPGRSWSQPVPIIDVVRGAMSEVEDYQRVRAVSQSKDAVIGSAAADLMHLLAELIENATLFSPSDTEVEVRAERVTSGFVIEIEDRGLGIQPDLLSEINQKLLRPQDFTVAEPDRLGLFVVGRLAARHGARVSLSESAHGGTTAVLLVPAGVLVAAGATVGANGSGEMPVIRPLPEPARRDQPSQDAFGLMPRRAVPPASPRQPSTAQPDTAQPAAARPDEPAETFPAPTALDGAARPRHAGVPLPRRADRAPADPAPADRAPADRAPADRAPADRAPADGDSRGTGTHRGLPRRVRQANLSPHLKNSAHPKNRGQPGSGPARSAALNPAAPSPAERTPEAARDLVAAFRSGWQRELPAPAPGSTAPASTAPASTAPAPTGPGVTQTQEKALPTTGPESSQSHPQGEEITWKSGARQEPEQT